MDSSDEFDSDTSLDFEPPPQPSAPHLPSMLPPRNPPIQIATTQYLRERQHEYTDSIAVRVRSVLAEMDKVGLNLPLFLDYLSWGDRGCIVDPTIRSERTGLMVSKELPHILERWLSPMHVQESRDVRAMGGRKHIEDFMLQQTQDICERELASLRPSSQMLMRDLTESSLTSKSLVDFTNAYRGCMEMGTGAPKLWNLLSQLTRTKRQERENTQKDSRLV